MAFVLYYFSLLFYFHVLVVWFSASVGAELCSLFLVLPLLPDRCAFGLRCLVPTLAAQFVQSQQPLLVGSPSAVTVCPAPALVVQGVWLQSFVPSCCSCLLSSLGVSFCHLGLLLHPILLLFLAWVSSFGVSSGLGLRCCGPGYGSSLFFVWGGGVCSFPCLCCFNLAFTTLLFCPGNLGFLDFLLEFLYSRLPVFAGTSEWFALALRFSLDGFMVRTHFPSTS